MATRPLVLLADEPTSRLDGANAIAVAILLARLARDTGAAVVCATHDPAGDRASGHRDLTWLRSLVRGKTGDPQATDLCSAVAALDCVSRRSSRGSAGCSKSRGSCEPARSSRRSSRRSRAPISDSLAFRTVVINLYRREWDDFIVTHRLRQRRRARCAARPGAPVVRVGAAPRPRFLQRGAYFVAAGEFDWDESRRHHVHAGHRRQRRPERVASGRRAVRADARADGELLGILSVDEPISGRKPSGDEIDVLVAVSEHAALAVQAAQEAARAQANRDALERLLAVSATLNETSDTSEAAARTSAPRSPRRSASRRSPCSCSSDDGLHRDRRRRSGFADGENIGVPLTADELERLLAPEFDVAGCYLIPHAAARAALPDRADGLQLEARRPRPVRVAERLAVRPAASTAAAGASATSGPTTRSTACGPTPERLQILRAFANQATTALEQASQFEEIQNAYEHHRALIDASPVAIVDFDLDGRVRSWNAGAAEIFGWTADEAIGRVSPIVPRTSSPAFLDERSSAIAAQARRFATSTCAACTATAR